MHETSIPMRCVLTIKMGFSCARWAKKTFMNWQIILDLQFLLYFSSYEPRYVVQLFRPINIDEKPRARCSQRDGIEKQMPFWDSRHYAHTLKTYESLVGSGEFFRRIFRCRSNSWSRDTKHLLVKCCILRAEDGLELTTNGGTVQS